MMCRLCREEEARISSWFCSDCGGAARSFAERDVQCADIVPSLRQLLIREEIRFHIWRHQFLGLSADECLVLKPMHPVLTLFDSVLQGNRRESFVLAGECCNFNLQI